MTVYKFSEQQFEAIQSALNAAIGMALRFDKSMIGKMSTASSMMDDVANEDGDLKPFSTYPEDREKLMSLASILQRPHDVETGEKAADELSDLVLAILSDEETDAFDAELDAADLMKIDEAWEKHKAAGPVAKVINDNQPGKTAIIEILRDPPTLPVGTMLFD